MPQKICSECESRVLAAYLLRQQTEKNFHTLVSMRHNKKRNNNLELLDNIIIVPKGTIRKDGSDNNIEVYNVQTAPPSSKVIPEEKTISSYIINENDIVCEEVYPDDHSLDDTVEDAVSFLAGLTKEDNNKNTSPSGTTLNNKKTPKQIDKSPMKSNDKFYQNRKHVCNVCEKRFLRKSNLVDHLRLHAGVKPYQCEICPKTFVQIGNYRAHMRIHSMERPFVCSICDKSYNQSSALTVHMRSHTNERNYICDVCPKGFTNASDLKKHSKVHDIRLQTKCELCKKMFAQKINYKIHMLKHHGVKV